MNARMLAAALALVLWAGAAQAQTGGTGLEVGTRVGYALPAGDATPSNGALPFFLDLGYRWRPSL